MKNFQALAQVDVIPLMNEIIRQPHLWKADTYLRDYPQGPFGDTETIFLRFPPASVTELERGLKDQHECIWMDGAVHLPSARPIIFSIMSQVYGERLGRVMINKLKPGGRITLLQYDDFAPDAAKVREVVINGGFKEERGPDGLRYTGISRQQVPHWRNLLEEVLGHRIDVKMAFFRLNLAGELPHSWVHSDEVCQSEYAGVLYLNTPEQCRGGTAFWKHRELGIDRLPAPDELEAEGLDPAKWYALMNEHWRELGRWEQVSLVGMRFNRLITYPVNRFHSRYPFEGFGQGPQDGRLVWVVFYSFA